MLGCGEGTRGDPRTDGCRPGAVQASIIAPLPPLGRSTHECSAFPLAQESMAALHFGHPLGSHGRKVTGTSHKPSPEMRPEPPTPASKLPHGTVSHKIYDRPPSVGIV